MKPTTPRTEMPSITRLQDRVNRLFSNFLDHDGWEFSSEEFVPALDVTDKPDQLEVKVEVPGVDPDDIEISVQDDVLTITGERKSEKEEKGDHTYRREMAYGRFSRALALPTSIVADEVEATSRNGVLTIRIPKSEVRKPKTIPVKKK